MDNTLINFGFPHEAKEIIKVIGVGGGGGNAVTHMYKEGIQDVSFALCNTDRQALMKSDVPVKICIGPTVTKGLGAGNKPEKAKEAALESEDEIRQLLSDGTEMVFITAGMGGGTGTGAAPVIAGIAKDMDILTIGIVTIPFKFEFRPKIIQALAGVEKMGENVDALLVINNERLLKIYSTDSISEAFRKVDNTLTVAAKSIAEIITSPGIINLDFADVNTTLKNGGVALMNNGFGEGERRLEQAIEEAFHSPLLNSDNVFSARKILFSISYSLEAELRMEEIKFVEDFMTCFNPQLEVIWGTAVDDALGKKIKFTVLAAGFGLEQIAEIREKHDEDTKRLIDAGTLRKADILRKQQEEDELIARFYGEEERGKIIIRPVSRSSFIVLSIDEMTDDDIISTMEENPTYNRDPKLIAHIRNQSAKVNNIQNAAETSTSTKSPAAIPDNNTQKIKFK